MSLESFVVRPQRRHVEKFREPEAWERLSAEDRAELVEKLAGLPSAYQDDDLGAKQFDYLVLLTQLAVLRADPAFTNLQARIIGIAAQLEELGNIPMVKAQLALIAEVQTDAYWQDIRLPMLEHLRRSLRSLVKLIEPAARKTVFSDFEDAIGPGVPIALPKVATATDKSRFLLKVRQFLTQQQDHISIRKLRRNEQLTPQDLAELERMFQAEGIATSEDLERLREEGGLGIFIRSLVGLDREAAKQALAVFMDGRTLTANQIEFINLVIDHLTERGVMDPRRLYESPFTDLDDQGVSGVFSLDDAKVLVQVLAEVQRRAAA